MSVYPLQAQPYTSPTLPHESKNSWIPPPRPISCQHFLRRVKGARPLPIPALPVPTLPVAVAVVVEVQVEVVVVVVPPGKAVVDSIQ